MGTMDEVGSDMNDVKLAYLRDYGGDRTQAAIMWCRDSLNSEAARNDKDKRKSAIELAQHMFELNIWQRSIVEEHV